MSRRWPWPTAPPSPTCWPPSTCWSGSGPGRPPTPSRLHISEKTVDLRVSAVLAKLGVRSRHEATQVAVARGIALQDGEPTAPT
jgi:hypothetical protein